MSNPNRTRFGIDFDYFDISKTILDKILLQQPTFHIVTENYLVILINPWINGPKVSISLCGSGIPDIVNNY